LLGGGRQRADRDDAWGQVRWERIERDATALLDTDGSGSIGKKDVDYYAKRAMHVLSSQGLTAGGFVSGCVPCFVGSGAPFELTTRVAAARRGDSVYIGLWGSLRM